MPYDAARYPGAPGVADVVRGANCQLFAYELLRANGLAVPPLRSSNLWEDTQDTFAVREPVPLDLLLFNASAEPWGAHVAVCVGPSRAIHLSKEVGRPAVWTFAEFAARPRYRCFLGAKRVRRTPCAARPPVG